MPRVPRNAFYVPTFEKISDVFLVRKASGGNGKVYDREAWFRESLTEAERMFMRILKEKTNPNRKNPRKYVVTGSVQAKPAEKRMSMVVHGP